MTKLNNEDLQALQFEVQRLLGRCLLRLQQYERLIKAMLADHSLSGPIDDLERIKATKIDDMARTTLGNLVGNLLGSYVVAGEIGPSEEAAANSAGDVNSFALQTTLSLPEAEFDRVESELREIVLLRNNLVHHFSDQHDLLSSDGCLKAQQALNTAYSRIDQHFGQLREWAKDMENTRKALLEVMQSEVFKDVFVNGLAPDGKVNWDASGIVSALREAFGALAFDGWAPVDEAGRWIAERYPEQLPEKYGWNSWRQVVHSAPMLELRYLQLDGQRTACYREQASAPK